MDDIPSPTPDLTDPSFVSPGIEGFLMFFAVAVVTILLARSMLKHVRKANFRAAEREGELYGPDVPVGTPDAVDAALANDADVDDAEPSNGTETADTDGEPSTNGASPSA